MIHYWINSEKVKNYIYIPKFYDPNIPEYLKKISSDYDIYHIGKLIEEGVLSLSTGHEVGKMAYGTGEIPFVRTSDISNWEIKTSPKQGVSEEIYEAYAEKQDVKAGDILLVRDGTYLIGTNCFVTELDEKILYQSHILKIRINDKERIPPEVFFLALNSDIVQQQIRANQFTADIIDTIGNRFEEVIIPIPKDEAIKIKLIELVKTALESRVRGKAFIKQCPTLIEKTLLENSFTRISNFFHENNEELKQELTQDTVTMEFGEFEYFWQSSDKIKNRIFLPKYYAPSIEQELNKLSENCFLLTLGKLNRTKQINYNTGDEIGKMAYGTGDIPFIRTSDFANWELKHDPKQGISEEIYDSYAEKQDVKVNDIFLVRDGTYLVGSSCIVTEEDARSLYCGGLYKISVLESEILDPWLLLGLLNSYIVKRQFRTKQFTRDVIDTLGKRITEVVIPIPKNQAVREGISEIIRKTIDSRIQARNLVKSLSNSYTSIEEIRELISM
jgi:hypothetical protein